MQAIAWFCFLVLSMVTRVEASEMIDQSEMIPVNGTMQFLLYRGEDQSKPLVLFVHGGPVSPLSMFARGFDGPFLKDFVVVHWDQRLSGKSYDPAVPVESFTADQIARDGLVVVEHLKKKFKREKIILVGHSWGSIIGAKMASARPESFTAYVSVGTVADMQAGDEAKFEFLKSSVERAGDDQDRVHLANLGAPPWREFAKLVSLSRLMNKFKGTFYGLSGEEIDRGTGQSTEYKEEDFNNLNTVLTQVWPRVAPYLESFKAAASMPSMPVRIYFAQGTHDMATPTSIARNYFSVLKADKEWVDFPASAHFPMYEEPEKFLELLKRASFN